MTKITSDWDEVDRELNRLTRMPTPSLTAELNGVMDFGFALTQDAVHRVTGALAASGKVEAGKSYGTHEWSGEITYGDEGVVDYAIYEERRGLTWVGASDVRGDHDFMRPMAETEPLFVATILGGLS